MRVKHVSDKLITSRVFHLPCHITVQCVSVDVVAHLGPGGAQNPESLRERLFCIAATLVTERYMSIPYCGTKLLLTAHFTADALGL